MKTSVMTAVLISGLAAAPAFAGHNNPWTDDLSILLMQFHDENQAKSIDTPGEDEMRGVMERNAIGKLDSDGARANGSGVRAGNAASSGASRNNGSGHQGGGGSKAKNGGGGKGGKR